jgi:hypothetical protein
MRWLLVGVLALGAGLRLRQYLAQHCYWHDEAMVVLNVFEKDSAGLMGVLDSNQAAPPAFLLAQRAMFVQLGRSELVMRFIPFVAGMIALALFAWLAWRLWGGKYPLLAIGAILMFACADSAIWHAVEAKQYSIDLLVAVMLLLVVLVPSKDQSPLRRLLLASLIAAPAVWFSYSTIFMFGGISLALLPAIARGRGKAIGAWALCNGIVAASFLIVYALVIREQQVSLLYEYWGDEFVDFSRPMFIPVWFFREAASICNYPMDLAGPILFPIVILGAVVMYRRGQTERLLALILPAALVLLAAALHRYPFGGSRLTLFLAPSVFILAGAGLLAIATHPRANWRGLWMVIPAAFVVIAMYHAGIYLIAPPARGNMAPSVAFVKAHWSPGDPIYSNKVPEFRCYWPDAPVKNSDLLRDSTPLAPFWLALSYVEGKKQENLQRQLNRVVPRAEVRNTFTATGTTAIFFKPRKAR